jgi:hypothetical protein
MIYLLYGMIQIKQNWCILHQRYADIFHNHWA